MTLVLVIFLTLNQLTGSLLLFVPMDSSPTWIIENQRQLNHSQQLRNQCLSVSVVRQCLLQLLINQNKLLNITTGTSVKVPSVHRGCKFIKRQSLLELENLISALATGKKHVFLNLKSK
jgi:hypothetical protein